MIAIGSESETLQLFKGLFKSGKIIEMPILFSQTMGDDTFETNGLFTYYTDKQYQYTSSDQSIFFNQDTVWTQNHYTRQIIIDQLMPGEFTFFNILSGNFDGINFESPILEKGVFNFNYYIPDWDVLGGITLYPNGHPKRININGDEKQSISISIGKLAYSDIQQFNVSFSDTWEVIDLRE